jgi:hypothetical protein
MTRKQEIMKAARVYANGIAQHLPNKIYCEEDFSTGAEWADRTMIDKACSWLLEWETHQGEDIEVVEQFKQAMKGSNQ